MRKIICCSALLTVLLCAGGASAGGVREVTDQLGERMSIPESPRRIVSLAPCITEIIYALGQGRCLQGTTTNSNYPLEAARLPKVGTYIHPDLERVVALRPDLCIATNDGNPLDAVVRLRGLGIPVYAVSTFDLRSVMEAIQRIGALVEAENEARRLADDMSKRIERVRRIAQAAHHRPRVFFQVGASPIVSIGSKTCIHELITTAGGINIAEGDTLYPRFSCEEVMARVPEIIIITSMGGGRAAAEARDRWLGWKNIPAVRSGRVYLVDSDIFDRPGPRLVEGIELLVKLFHPDLLSHEAP